MVDADTINTFKSRLDKRWLDQDAAYNFNCELTGTRGNLYIRKQEYLRPFVRIGFDWIGLLTGNPSSTQQVARPATKRFHPSDWRALEASYDFSLFYSCCYNDI